MSVRRLLREKFVLGLFDHPFVDVDRAAATVGRADFVAAARPRNAPRSSGSPRLTRARQPCPWPATRRFMSRTSRRPPLTGWVGWSRSGRS